MEKRKLFLHALVPGLFVRKLQYFETIKNADILILIAGHGGYLNRAGIEFEEVKVIVSCIEFIEWARPFSFEIQGIG